MAFAGYGFCSQFRILLGKTNAGDGVADNGIRNIPNAIYLGVRAVILFIRTAKVNDGCQMILLFQNAAVLFCGTGEFASP